MLMLLTLLITICLLKPMCIICLTGPLRQQMLQASILALQPIIINKGGIRILEKIS
jgi:hypothetical protein